MTGFALIGALVIAGVLGVGVYWLIMNVNFGSKGKRK